MISYGQLLNRRCGIVVSHGPVSSLLDYVANNSLARQSTCRSRGQGQLSQNENGFGTIACTACQNE